MTMTDQLCTKPAGFPLDPLNLGGCILERNHDGPCGFQFGNGVMRIQRHEEPVGAADHISAADAYMESAMHYYRLTRRNFRVSLVASAMSVLSAAWLVWSAFTR